MPSVFTCLITNVYPLFFYEDYVTSSLSGSDLLAGFYALIASKLG